MRASKAEIAKYLEGNWQEDLLFVLQQEQQGYEFCLREVLWHAIGGVSELIDEEC